MKLFENEGAFTRWVVRQANERGWKAAHLGNMRLVPNKGGGGYHSVAMGEARGFPDVIALHPNFGLLFAELKMPDGKPNPAQMNWLVALREARAGHVYVWYPNDQEEILDVLDGRTVGLFQLEGV